METCSLGNSMLQMLLKGVRVFFVFNMQRQLLVSGLLVDAATVTQPVA